MFHNGATPSPQTVARIEAELRAIARHHFQGERPDHTLQPTALVSEVWLRLAAKEKYDFADMTAFRAWASSAIRRILVDHARRKRAEKRGGGWTRCSPDELAVSANCPDLEQLDEAMTELEEHYPRAARAIQLRFFVGMSQCEAARVLGVSERALRRDWAFARAWLRGRMDNEEAEG